MRAYKKKWQSLYMSLDIKPFGKWKRAIEGSVRMDAKKEIREQSKSMCENGVCDLNMFDFCRCPEE